MGIIELQGFHLCHAIHHRVIKEGHLPLTSEEAFTPPPVKLHISKVGRGKAHRGFVEHLIHA